MKRVQQHDDIDEKIKHKKLKEAEIRRNEQQVKVDKAKEAGIPIRVGVNSGSLEKDIIATIKELEKVEQ